MRGSKTSDKESALTAEFVEECWSLVFHGIGVSLHDADAWSIDPEDAKELGKRTIKLLKSLDPKSSAKLEKRIAKYAPAVSLGMMVVAVAAPRVVHTKKMRDNAASKRVPSSQEVGNRGSAAASSVATSVYPPSGTTPVPANGNGNRGQPEPAIVVFRPIRGEDRVSFREDDEPGSV